MAKLSKPKEASVHYQVAQYLKLQYPKVIFRTDFSAGCKMTMGQAVKHKSLQAGRAYPDLFIAQPKFGTSQVSPSHHLMFEHMYCAGLFLELKREGVRIKKKNGEWADEHIAEQAAIIGILRLRGYKAEFAIGFDEAKKLIDEYLN
jgi:hypothetical protein